MYIINSIITYMKDIILLSQRRVDAAAITSENLLQIMRIADPGNG
jgi:hypothetical protein